MAVEDSPVLCLYGDLELHVFEARSLPNMDLFTERLRLCFSVCRTTPEGHHYASGGSDASTCHDRKLHHHKKIITSDSYVTICVPQATLARSRVISNSQNPKWNERFNIPLAHPLANLEIRVKDDDVFRRRHHGEDSHPGGEDSLRRGDLQLVPAHCPIGEAAQTRHRAATENEIHSV